MSYKNKLKDIKAFVFDVDGVFTDGTVYLMPDGSMCRAMNVLDGFAVAKAIKKGFPMGIITGGNDPMVKHRLLYLGIIDYYPQSVDKRENYEKFKSKYNLEDKDILMMGDDVPDLPLLKASGLATCPINAIPEVKSVSDYISPIHGGKGAVRDIIEQVMKAQNIWEDTQDDTRSI